MLHIHGFTTKAEAEAWIKDASGDWFKKYTAAMT